MLDLDDIQTVDRHIKDCPVQEAIDAWCRIKTALAELGTTPNKQSTPSKTCYGCHHSYHTCMQKDCVDYSKYC